jgi:hypothetical protein
MDRWALLVLAEKCAAFGLLRRNDKKNRIRIKMAVTRTVDTNASSNAQAITQFNGCRYSGTAMRHHRRRHKPSPMAGAVKVTLHETGRGAGQNLISLERRLDNDNYCLFSITAWFTRAKVSRQLWKATLRLWLGVANHDGATTAATTTTTTASSGE